MLRVLLAKDLRRAWRNPLPALINIALPICITALIGLAFGGKSGNELERIHFAVVDEDQGFFSDFLRGAMTQKKGGEHLDPVFMDRETALREINDNKIGGALIIPTNFTHNYFKGTNVVKLELIKNPAQSIQPAALEELVGYSVTILNAVSRNFQAQFPDWRGAFEGDIDQHRIAQLVEHVGDRLESVKKYVNPPLVGFESETNATSGSYREERVAEKPASGVVSKTNPPSSSVASKTETKSGGTSSQNQIASVSKAGEPKRKSMSNFSKVFAWVLPGVSAMFLLFLANTAMTDLYREMRFRTFERYQTMRAQLFPFVAGKVLYAVVFLLLCAAIMLCGGGMIFRVEWAQPLALATLVVAYSCCAAGMMALLVALIPDERRASTLNSVFGMLLGFAGGCMFPARQLPPLIRDHLTPLLPSFWFVDAIRMLQDGNSVAWGLVSLKLIAVSVVLIVVAVAIFQSRFKKGLRA